MHDVVDLAGVLGVLDRKAWMHAVSLGIGMQITNICRDVGEDARAGRLYLPRVLLREHGIDPADFIQNPRPGPELTAVRTRLLQEADQRYQKADEGIRQLPWRCRPGIWAARRLYAEIGRTLAQEGYDPISQRAVVNGSRKCQILMGLIRGAAANPAVLSAPCAPENRFLIDAVPRGNEWQNPAPPRRFSPSAYPSASAILRVTPWRSSAGGSGGE